ncbi:hypothetical protein H310_08361 [Aphanomyces invadans]|uniref:Ataxin-2 C-terminal domain-containing protein n=1 Tax=Aphanomyces invadans TaxID=157072 RepID=A0A024TZU0_9STRA|nr:hypothetical protein H310_08361 [Aphanomyces invadans]ETV98862.1 hypothetical protein H310_08361 [Aphanomyces invadans]|eukprot:XP_008872290.1 hypothetical protein H310_08361 [Aphanomyces invadans]
MKLNPNAAAFVPTFASWSAPQAPAATEEVKYCDEYEEDSYDPNYYPSDDYDGEDEISELLAEIERMQLEADMTRELETLKAQGRSEDADLWNTWMAGAPPPQDFSHQEEASPMSSYHYPSTQHYRHDNSQFRKKTAVNPYSYNSRNAYHNSSPRNSSPKHQPHHRPNYTSRAIYQPRATN